MMKIIEYKPEFQYQYAHILSQNFFAKIGIFSPQKLARFFIDSQIAPMKNSLQGHFIAVNHKQDVTAIMKLKWVHIKPEKIAFLKSIRKYKIKALMVFFLLSLLATKAKKGECYIEHIAVDTTMQGQGIGKLLMDFAYQYAKKQGFQKLSLHVKTDNKGAIRFYKKQNMNIEKIEKHWLLYAIFGIESVYYMTRKI